MLLSGAHPQKLWIHTLIIYTVTMFIWVTLEEGPKTLQSKQEERWSDVHLKYWIIEKITLLARDKQK